MIQTPFQIVLHTYVASHSCISWREFNKLRQRDCFQNSCMNYSATIYLLLLSHGGGDGKKYLYQEVAHARTASTLVPGAFPIPHGRGHNVCKDVRQTLSGIYQNTTTVYQDERFRKPTVITTSSRHSHPPPCPPSMSYWQPLLYLTLALVSPCLYLVLNSGRSQATSVPALA